jgi:hypothetical protein
LEGKDEKFIGKGERVEDGGVFEGEAGGLMESNFLNFAITKKGFLIK